MRVGKFSLFHCRANIIRLARCIRAKQLTKPDAVMNPSHFHPNIDGELGKWGRTMTTFRRRPQFKAPVYKLPSARAAEKEEDDQMPSENLSDLLGQVSKNSTSEIDSLIGDFARLREKLQTDGEHIQREVEEYRALSEQVMQMTKTISESVEKVRASADRPTTF